jgi:hypothetical protein
LNRALQKFRSGGYSDLATLDFNADELKELLASARLEDRFDVYRLKAWYHYLRKEFDLSREAQIEAFKLQPTIETIKNIGILFRTLGQAGNGLEFMLRHEGLFRDSYEYYGVLAHNAGSIGDLKQASEFGRRALTLKDASTSIGTNFKPAIAPPFAPDPSRNIIAFSLFGSERRYVDPLRKSVEAKPHLYPLWTIRIYVDGSVPDQITRNFERLGCEVIRNCPTELPGTFWRFLVADDHAVDRYIIRDADSVLNIRERVAVDEWISSSQPFHVMRDAYSHCELILAGMWGAVRGATPPMEALVRDWLGGRRGTTYNQTTSDQIFLRERVWPYAKQSALIHDSFFRMPLTRDFPAVGSLPPWKHVGQNDAILLKPLT